MTDGDFKYWIDLCRDADGNPAAIANACMLIAHLLHDIEDHLARLAAEHGAP